MRIDMDNLIESDTKGITDLDDVAEVRYPTGCVDMTKLEILCKLSEIEFKMTGTWTHEFLDEFEGKYRYMKAPELAKILADKLQEIYDWDERAYGAMLG
jgi:uncharacterized protein YqfB (UPF0267 family)